MTDNAAEKAIAAVRAANLTLATAESCTGGNIAHKITEIAGCSDVFRGAVVSYCNEVKQRVLGVPAAVLKANGAVSEPTVRAMAEGVARLLDAGCAVATSGIAGPGGAVPGKPVGTVWIAATVPGLTVAEVCHFDGDRQDVISQASAEALSLLARTLQNHKI